MTIPYNPTVPQGTQQINNTQVPIEVNFQSISDFVEVNHVGFNNSLEGKHTFISYVAQSTDPSTSANEMALYSKYVSGDTNLMEMFYRYPSNGTVVQLTGTTNYSTGTNGGTFPSHSGILNGATASWGSGFWQYLSNGVLIMGWTPSNYISPGQSYPVGTPIPLIIPSGYGAPGFTQTPFNAQYVIMNQTTGTTINNQVSAVAALNSKTINLYNSYALSGSQTYPGIFIIAIGV